MKLTCEAVEAEGRQRATGSDQGMNDWDWFGGQEWGTTGEEGSTGNQNWNRTESGMIERPAMMPRVRWPLVSGLDFGENRRLENRASTTSTWQGNWPELPKTGEQTKGQIVRGTVVECAVPMVVAQAA